MREFCEFRIHLENVSDIDFHPAKVEILSSSTGKVVLETTHPAYEKLLQRSRLLRGIPGTYGAYAGWSISRKYEQAELDAATWFHLRFTSSTMCDSRPDRTVYDLSSACPFCGKGRIQLTPAILPRSMPKRNMVNLKCGYVLLSRLTVQSLVAADARGFDLCPGVLSGTPEAKDLIKRAKKGEDTVAAYRQPIESISSELTAEYYQVIVRSKPLEFSTRQITGSHPSDIDTADKRSSAGCPLGHSVGWVLLGPLKARSIINTDSDWHIMDKSTSGMSGLLMPSFAHVVSQKVRRVITKNRRAPIEFDPVELDEI